jgi:hypothetical protein
MGGTAFVLKWDAARKCETAELSCSAASASCAAGFGSYRLVVFFATVRFAAVGGCGVGRAAVCRCGVGVMYGGVVDAGALPSPCGRWPASTTFDVSSSSTTAEAMLTPAVAIAPVRPWSYAEEDPVVEIARPIKTTGGTAVWCIAVVAVGTHGRSYADTNFNSCVSRWHQGQGRE